MKLSKKGLELLMQSEKTVVKGTKHMAYDSSAGLTIGIGHLVTGEEKLSGLIVIGGKNVKWSNGITHKQAKSLLASDVIKYEGMVNRLVKNNALSQNEFDSLVNFSFDIGLSAFAKSTLCSKVGAGDLQSVPSQMMRWVRADGKKSKELNSRREKESAMWAGSESRKVNEP